MTWLREIRVLYRLNRQRLRHPRQTAEFAAADAKLRQQVAAMAARRDCELAEDKLREPCRKALVSLNEHYSGLTLFVDDPRIPLDNNYGERLIHNPAFGRKNYYGSGAEWSVGGNAVFDIRDVGALEDQPAQVAGLVFGILRGQRRQATGQSRILLTLESVGNSLGGPAQSDAQPPYRR